MSKSQSSDRVDDLGAIFVEVTGDDSVTERQEEGHSNDRELREEGEVDVDDGLEDAVAGAEVAAAPDPV